MSNTCTLTGQFGNEAPDDDVSAIRRLQEGANEQFASLDNLLDGMFEPIPQPIASFIDNHISLDNTKMELLSNLGYDSLASFVRSGALSVRDMVSLVGRSYIHHKDLALVLFVVKVMASVIHDQAQAQQHNALMVGNSSCTVDLNTLPTDFHGISAFFATINSHKVKSVVYKLKRKDIAGEIKHEISQQISDPHLGSYV